MCVCVCVCACVRACVCVECICVFVLDLPLMHNWWHLLMGGAPPPPQHNGAGGWNEGNSDSAVVHAVAVSMLVPSSVEQNSVSRWLAVHSRSVVSASDSGHWH